MNFKNATFTARETTYSEEKAFETAKVATDSSNPKIFLNEVSTRAMVTPFSTNQENMRVKI